MKILLLLLLLSSCSNEYKCVNGIVWEKFHDDVWVKRGHGHFGNIGETECIKEAK